MLSVSQTVSKIACTSLLTLLCLASAHAAPDTPAPREGEVIARVLNIRSGPGKSYRVIGKLQKGNRIVILEPQTEWVKISQGGKEGFVSREHIRLIPLPTLAGDAAPAPFDPSKSPEAVKTLKKESGLIEKQIAQHEARVAAYTEKETKLIDDLDHLGRLLNQTKLQVKKSREESLSIEEKLKNTESEYLLREKEAAQLEAYAARRLVALFKLYRLGKMPVLASADSIYDLLNRKKALERILSADKAVWDELSTKKNRLVSLRSDLDNQKRAYDGTIKRLDELVDTMGRQNRERSQLLEEIRGKKRVALAAIDSLKESAAALDREVESYGWEVHPASMPGDGTNKKPFEAFKGLLQTPVPGKITAFYGLKTEGRLQTPNIRNGIDIDAEPGEPIRAVHGGTVIYADWFKGYGNMIIIDHGNSYCTIYAHAEELFKSKGDAVEMNEVIGTVGETGSMTGTKLYFEIRYHGKPINPLAWFKRN